LPTASDIYKKTQ